MMQSAVPWKPLPDDLPARVAQDLDRALSTWNETWLCDSGLQRDAGRLFRDAASAVGKSTSLTVCSPSAITLALPVDGYSRLAAMALGSSDAMRCNGIALQLVTGLGKRIAHDLLRRIEQVVTGVDVDASAIRETSTSETPDNSTPSHRQGNGPNASVQFDLSSKAFQAPLALRLPVAILARHLPSGAPRPLAAPLARRHEALGQTTVNMVAILGQCPLAVPDLVNLTIGDVLILDRRLADSVDLYLGDLDHPLLSAALCRSGEQLALRIHASVELETL
jgi:flagellar motor switch/type III secretory pathway protein FliN